MFALQMITFHRENCWRQGHFSLKRETMYLKTLAKKNGCTKGMVLNKVDAWEKLVN